MESLCVVCREAQRRARGLECRRCYKTLWQREKRKQERFENSHVSLDSATYAVNRKWYDLWEQEQD